jgi:hypothetical protein
MNRVLLSILVIFGVFGMVISAAYISGPKSSDANTIPTVQQYSHDGVLGKAEYKLYRFRIESKLVLNRSQTESTKQTLIYLDSPETCDSKQFEYCTVENSFEGLCIFEYEGMVKVKFTTYTDLARREMLVVSLIAGSPLGGEIFMGEYTVRENALGETFEGEFLIRHMPQLPPHHLPNQSVVSTDDNEEAKEE